MVHEKSFNDTAERLRDIRSHLGLSQMDFAKKLKISQRKISRLENNQPLDRKTSDIIMRELDVDTEWLMYGQGVSPLDSKLGKKKGYDFYDIPVLDADRLSIADNDLDTLPFSHKLFRMYFPRLNEKEMKMMWVMGDSMFPLVNAGDIVMFIDNGKYRGDGVYVVKIFESLAIRRLYRRTQNEFTLICDNERYQQQNLEFADKDLEIIGNVIWTSHVLSK